MHQSAYVGGIRLVPVEGSRKAAELLEAEEVEGYRSALGAVQWAGQRSRPDLAYEACRAATISGSRDQDGVGDGSGAQDADAVSGAKLEQ